MLYAFTKNEKLHLLALIAGLEIRESDDPSFMSAMGQITREEASRRFSDDNKAYVAYLHGVPAAFGWVAQGKAHIGELDHSFILPLRHRYLWNFRTLPDFQGRGIYTRLLQHILRVERHRAHTFWILHAPENMASRKGIQKAGFEQMGLVSVAKDKRLIFLPEGAGRAGGDLVQEVFAFPASQEPQATCWNCSSPFLKKRKEACCCKINDRACNRHLFNETPKLNMVTV
ncbi:GNAT family N-acetyltransferase [Pontibacter sp. MBLB2868]|uniref:GNAT family N-acetyltransferase n=1 Tax=Pontibacter sp. MBLB2868 TaxID=3451555 RepID=UPI003F7552CC